MRSLRGRIPDAKWCQIYQYLGVYYKNWGHTSLPKGMQAQPGVVFGFADMGAKRPDWGLATLSPDRCNGLPK